MIRLGHIEYSNCYPVHALLVERTPAGVVLVPDTPAHLNRALYEGAIDVAPCSSIEYARHPELYRLLPGFAIGSNGPVGSILLESTMPLAGLDGATVAVPTASATSVVLLRILLELRVRIRVHFSWYDQATAGDPLEAWAAAALRIGDIALARAVPAGRTTLDLGAAWTEWTGLPFAFAMWHVRRDTDPAEVARLLTTLHESRAYFLRHAPALAQREARRFGVAAPRLLEYWRSLRYVLDDEMQRGLLHFYQLAAELGEIEVAPALALVDGGA